MNAPYGDRWADWQECERVLKGHPPSRTLTKAEKAVIFRAIIAGGGGVSAVATLLHTNQEVISRLAAHVENTGGVDGYPMVDGVTLTWYPAVAA